MYKSRGKRCIRVRFWSNARHTKGGIFRCVQRYTVRILSTTSFDENSDLSTTYLGKADISKNNKIKAGDSFPISEQGYTMGKLLDSTECQILLDTGASKSFMSKSYFMHWKSHHSLPKFTSKTQRIQVGNGQFVSVLIIVPVIVDIHGHRFEIYTLVSEIHENVRSSNYQNIRRKHPEYNAFKTEIHAQCRHVRYSQ